MTQVAGSNVADVLSKSKMSNEDFLPLAPSSTRPNADDHLVPKEAPDFNWRSLFKPDLDPEL